MLRHFIISLLLFCCTHFMMGEGLVFIGEQIMECLADSTEQKADTVKPSPRMGTDMDDSGIPQSEEEKENEEKNKKERESEFIMNERLFPNYLFSCEPLLLLHLNYNSTSLQVISPPPQR